MEFAKINFHMRAFKALKALVKIGAMYVSAVLDLVVKIAEMTMMSVSRNLANIMELAKTESTHLLAIVQRVMRVSTLHTYISMSVNINSRADNLNSWHMQPDTLRRRVFFFLFEMMHSAAVIFYFLFFLFIFLNWTSHIILKKKTHFVLCVKIFMSVSHYVWPPI